MITTERANVSVPKSDMERARELWPATRGMSGGKLLRYALAKALGASDAEALAFTRDARFGTTRKPHSDMT